MIDKPLFIPLKCKYFAAFKSGIKTTEYRKYGPRWNERVCKPGWEVVLSLGQGKKHRLRGVIKAFRKLPVLKSKAGFDLELCYGTGVIAMVAEIDIDVKND
jgi:hypothetical protein